MKRAVVVFLVFGLLGGCATPQTKTPPSVLASIASESSSGIEQADRPQRVAYALKSISFIMSESQMMQKLNDGIRIPPPNYFDQFPVEKRARAAELWSQELVPETLGRFPEMKEILAGVLADVLTTDELRRLAEVGDQPGAVRLQTKQPLTDQDVQDFGRLGIVALAKRLEETKETMNELMRIRSERWAISIVGDLMRRKPDLFSGVYR